MRTLADGQSDSILNYSLPVRRAAPSDETLVILSVDWEKDFGRWQDTSVRVDCGGSRVATPVLCELLDLLQIPCTWFVECNAVDVYGDMCQQCPEQLAFLAGRPADEIGLHVHWPDHQAQPPLSDRSWTGGILERTTASLSEAIRRPVRSFRSGGHFAIPGLPAKLDALQYVFDGSVEDRRPGWHRRIHAGLGYGVHDYHPDAATPLKPGTSQVLEVPTSLHLHGFDALMRVWKDYFPRLRQRVISIYLHSCELTLPNSASDDRATLDQERLQGLEALLRDWIKCPQLRWVTAAEAARILTSRGAA